MATGKRTINRLTAKAVESLTKPGRHADGGNLYLAVRPGGSRQWVFFFRWQGKLKEMSLGAYPALSLKAARELAANARTTIARGNDPLDARRRVEQETASV